MILRSSRCAALLLVAGTPLAAQTVTEVQVAPPSITIKVGERYGLLATAYDRLGNVVPAARMTWVSSNPQVALVDNSGTVVGVSPGAATVEARSGRRSGRATVQVSPVAPGEGGAPTGGAGAAAEPFAGQPEGSGPAAFLRIDPPSVYLLPSENTRVTPRALREDGAPAAPVQVTWKSLRETIASVDPHGTVVGLAPGQGTIQMTGPGGMTATAPVVVAQADYAILEGTALTMAPGETDTLHVIVPTQENRSVTAAALTWVSSDQSVAQVSLTGVVKAVGSGKATLTVTGLLQQRTVEILVHRAVEFLEVRPTTRGDVSVPLTATVRFTATALAADSSPVPEALLVWSVGDSSVATFDRGTLTLTGRRVGHTQLSVRGPGPNPLRAVWTVDVIAGGVTLPVARLGLALQARKTLEASFIDDSGAVLGPARGLTWSSDAPAVAAVSENGAVTGTGYGRARITATAPGGKSASAEIFVEDELLVTGTRGGPSRLYWVDRANLAALRRVSADSGSATDAAISPDGSRIAFVSTRHDNPDIYLMDADGTNLTRVTSDPQADGRPAFSADGAALVFQSLRSGKLQIWTAALDGGGARALTTDSVSQTPAVSPNGATIAYAAVRNRSYDIWLMGRDGGNQRAFTTTPQVNETEPRFLRDGSLAYIVERREGSRTVRQVVKADLATGATTPLTGTDLPIASFAVSSGGDLIALVVPADPGNRRNPQYRVYLQTVGGGAPTPIPAGPAEQMTAPAFLP